MGFYDPDVNYAMTRWQPGDRLKSNRTQETYVLASINDRTDRATIRSGGGKELTMSFKDLNKNYTRI
jgi:hypothetical protein